uniref:Secreted protein n=1 Tax=Helianthus annuus TaxID=4232 RepID=A0A251S6J4_HELAN
MSPPRTTFHNLFRHNTIPLFVVLHVVGGLAGTPHSPEPLESSARSINRVGDTKTSPGTRKLLFRVICYFSDFPNFYSYVTRNRNATNVD